MKKSLILIIGIILFSNAVNAQKAFKIYSKEGKEVSFEKMVKALAKSNVILFGEQHNNPICHWMQLKVTQGVYEINGSLIMGAEMFESDNQLLVNEYFEGFIRTKDFEKEMRLWDNYKTDYKPLIEFAKTNNINFVATNVPRRYAAIVSKYGFSKLDSLSEDSKAYFAPLPILYDTLNPSVNKMLNMDFGHGKGGPQAELMAKAQSVKDATMAYFILKNYEKSSTFIHFQGDFHSSNSGGIYWYLKNQAPEINILTISSVEANGDLKFEDAYSDLGDFILVIAEDMTKTY